MNKIKYKVESTYKNPDKYIDRLKGRLLNKEFLLRDRDNIIKNLKGEIEKLNKGVLGERVFFWSNPENIRHAVGDLSRDQALKFKPSTVVFMKGVAIETKLSREAQSSGATFEFTEVYSKG